MLSSHEVCPVCHKEMIHSKRINQPCKIMDGKKLSFVESICNYSATDNAFQHIFFQITSLYGELLYTKIYIVETKLAFEVEINYPKSKSEITYFNKSYYDHASQTWSGGEPEKIELDNRLLELDFPTLEKTIRRVKTLAPFL